MANVLEIIKNEITQDYYKNNFPNDGQRFVAWYMRNIHNMDRLGYSQINFLFILTLIQRDDGQKKQTLEERTTEPGV